MKKPWYSIFSKQSMRPRLADTEPGSEQGQNIISVQNAPQGVSGTEKFGGVFTEDYFRSLQGSKKAKEYDKMRRGDARVKMCLSAVKGPIRSANWNWQPAQAGDEQSQKMADFLNFIFKEDLGLSRKKEFKTLINEALTVCDFGFSLFERVHKSGQNPTFGPYVGLAQFGWRHPRTIEFWNTDKDGELETVEQWAYGDVNKMVKMDARFLNIITMDREGDNYEGISLLRPCYGAWSRKQMYLKLMAIGIERMAIPTPKVKVPSGKEASPEFDNMVDVLEKLTSHQCNYVTYPEGWELDFLVANFDAEKVKSSIQFENEEMTFAFLANFLLLGSGGNAGAYALSEDLSDFFTKSIMYIADLIADEFNKVGRELIDLNYGPQEKYPTMVPQGIIDEISESFGNLMKSLTDSKHITPDDTLEDELRRRMKIPSMREKDKGKRDKAPAQPDPGAPDPSVDPSLDPENPANDNPNSPPDDQTDKKPKLTDFQRRRIALAESKAQQKIGAAQERARAVIKKHLRSAASAMVELIIKKYKDLPDAQKIDAINGVDAGGGGNFRTELRQELVDIAFDAIESARREVPKAKKAKLAEFEDLPKRVQKFLNMQSRLLVASTYADLEKVVLLQFGDSVISTDSANLIEQDLIDSAEAFIEGASIQAAGGNAGSRTVAEARNAFFFNDEVLQEIESFTFVNGDPVSEICQSLAGQTCSKSDVEAQRLFPPLHHNCKSYIVPNLVGDENNPEVTGFETKFTPGL